MRTKLPALLASALVLAACGPVGLGEIEQGTLRSGLTAGGTVSGVTFDAIEATATLDMANTASETELDDEIGLRSTAARRILAARPIASLEALDSVSYVGASALRTLRAYVPTWLETHEIDLADPAPAEITLEGVTFTADEASVVLELCNTATEAFLDLDVALSATAARNLVAARPLADLPAVAAVPYVGGSALTSLRDFVPRWAPAISVSGVSFTATEAAATLALVNGADAVTLDADAGLDVRAANNIVAARPIADLEALDAVAYVGTRALEQLRAFAADWTAPSDPVDPDATPLPVDLLTLADDAATLGVDSPYFDRIVTISRAVISSSPRSTASGLSFDVADPRVGALDQLPVYLADAAGLDTGFASRFDEVSITGRFTLYRGVFELLIERPGADTLSLQRSGLDHDDYQDVQAAWHSTAANPEGVVRIVSTFGYTFMVPLPQVLDHPMWNGNPPAAPRDSGNEQDHAWNAAAQDALDAWRSANP